MKQLKKRAQQLRNEVNGACQKINLPKLQNELKELHKKIAQADFWQNSKNAQEVSKREANLARRATPWTNLQNAAKEVYELARLNDPNLDSELNLQIDKIEKNFESLKQDLKFQGPYDDHGVILAIYAGAGGTDAQDWAQMLLRMYLRWAERSKLKAESLDQSLGEEAGVKSASIKLSGGDFLYGKLAGENGVHRLVRLSPFNADNLRQTSFAKVEIFPLIEQSDAVELDEKDLKIDVYRAGGHGGQSVNTTDSAVRLTHLPTGISVAIQNERSQLQNKETALSILKSKLAALQMEQHAKTLAEIKGPNQSAEWGNQIRSYVLHPYKQVKDNRSGYETSDAEGILDGNLDPLITVWLDK